MKHYEIERREADFNAGRDRGKDTIQQFGTLQELTRTVDMQFTIGTSVAIRTRMDLLMGQYMLLRGEDRRRAEFPDLFTVDSLNEGVKGHVPMLCLRLGQGKVRSFSFALTFGQTNQEGKAQYGVAFRNKDVRYCPVGAVALWLFHRFHILSEPWPNFSNRLEWYSTKLLSKIANSHEPMSPDAHREICNSAFAKAQCVYLSGTHVGRREGCKLADMLDVPDTQMRRLGGWDSSCMTQHYSTGMARQGARIVAGHGADSGILMLE